MIFWLLLAALVVLGVVVRRWAVLVAPLVVWPVYFAVEEGGEFWELVLPLTLAASALLTALGVLVGKRLGEPARSGQATR